MADQTTAKHVTFRACIRALIDAEYQLREAAANEGCPGQVRWRLRLAADRAASVIEAAGENIAAPRKEGVS